MVVLKAVKSALHSAALLVDPKVAKKAVLMAAQTAASRAEHSAGCWAAPLVVNLVGRSA